MKRATPLILFAFCAGCAGVTPDVQPPAPVAAPRAPAPRALSQPEQLDLAVKHLRQGEISAARKLLTAIADARGVAGVTDEAIFRLALLSLRPGGESATAQQLLRRLKKEYPASPWTAQAHPLSEHLSGSDELRRQSRSYRTQRDILTRENGELKETIEQLKRNIEELKHLDLELEKNVH